MAQQETTPLSLLLERGRSWEEGDKIFQAIATYFRLMEYHSGTDEAGRARGRLFDLAQRLEVEGKVYQATHLYQRLAAL
ncbi:MAG: hypothetical protein ABID84_04335 [Chloroflexota bacterium]